VLVDFVKKWLILDAGDVDLSTKNFVIKGLSKNIETKFRGKY
jgi:hypothetical protein